MSVKAKKSDVIDFDKELTALNKENWVGKLYMDVYKVQKDESTFIKNFNIMELCNTTTSVICIIPPAMYKPSIETSKKLLIKEIQRKALENNYQLVIKETTASKIRLICSRHRVYRKRKAAAELEEYCSHDQNTTALTTHDEKDEKDEKSAKKKKNTRKTSTSKPVDIDKCCRFQLSIFVDRQNDYYYFSSMIGMNIHAFHPPVAKGEKKLSTPLSSDEQGKLPPSRKQASAIENESIVNLKPTVVENIKRTAENVVTKVNVPNKETDDVKAAEKLEKLNDISIKDETDKNNEESAEEDPRLYNGLMWYVKEIYKYEDQLSPEMKKYIEKRVENLTKEVILHIDGKFDPPSQVDEGAALFLKKNHL